MLVGDSPMIRNKRVQLSSSSDEQPIIPFDYGSGHIVPNASNSPGLVYDMTDDEYDTFSCAIGSPDVTQARCDELEALGFSFEPADLNQPNIFLGYYQ